MTLEIESQQREQQPQPKIIARDVVLVRGAVGGQNPPLIVSIPRTISSAANMTKGDEVRIYTDGRRIYLEKLEEPVL